MPANVSVISHHFNHGTIASAGKNSPSTNNGATQQHVKVGDGSFYLDGVNDYIDGGEVLNSNSFSLSIWVKIPSSQTEAMIYSKWTGEGGITANRFGIGMVSSVSTSTFVVNVGGDNVWRPIGANLIDDKGALKTFPPENKMDGMFAVKMIRDR